ncbi:MAG: hypothetical protein K8S16_12960, partial [Bacteroidales bacterium]|nr:hypothetical protein [Bacteroidales bacterium]
MKKLQLFLINVLMGLILLSAAVQAQNTTTKPLQQNQEQFIELQKEKNQLNTEININGSDNGNKFAQTFSVGSILVDGNSSNEVQISELDNLCILVSTNGESITFTCGYEMICPGTADDAKVQIHFVEGGGNPNLDEETTGGNATGTLSITKTLYPGELTSGKVRLYAFYKDYWGVIQEEEWEYSYNTTSPAAPSLVSPTNNAMCVPGGNFFDWSSVSGADEYQFWIFGTFPFGSPFYPLGGIENVTLSGFAYPGAYIYGNTYIWKVKTRDGNCWGDWTASRSFTAGWPPGAPSLQQPTNGAVNVEYAPTHFDWSDVSGADNYEIYISGSTYTTTNSYYDKTLSPNTYYTWKVRAHNGCGWGDWSSTWSFTTKPTPNPPYLTVTPSSNYNFGNITVGNCSNWQTMYTVENTGGGTLSGTVSESSQHFEIYPGDESFSLTASQTKSIRGRFCPQSSGSKSTQLTFDASGANNSPQNRTIEGYGDPNPPDLQLSNSTVPDPVPSGGGTYSLRVNNVGGETLYWSTENVPTWVILTPASGTVSGGSYQSVQVQVSQNANPDPRNCSIKFKNNNNSGDFEYLTINQNGETVNFLTVGELKITGDNITGTSPSYMVETNIRIGDKDLPGYLVTIPYGTMSVNTSNNTITVINGCTEFTVPSSYGWDWSFSGTTWNFNCTNGTASLSTTTLDLGSAGSISNFPGFNVIIDFEDKKLTGEMGFGPGYFLMIPQVSVEISFDLDYFHFEYKMGGTIDLSDNIKLDANNNYAIFTYYMNTNIIEFDASAGYGVCLKYLGNDGSEFRFIN